MFRWSNTRFESVLFQSRVVIFFPMARQPLGGLGRLIVRRFTITLFRHTTFGKDSSGRVTSPSQRPLPDNTHTRQTSMPPVGFFFLTNSWVFPFDPFLFCINPFSSFSCHLRSTTIFLQHNTDIHTPGGIRTYDPSKRAAEDPRPRPHGHWDRPSVVIVFVNKSWLLP
jgi:hypothetical protein